MNRISFILLVISVFNSACVSSYGQLNSSLPQYYNFGKNEDARGMVELNNRIFLAGSNDSCSISKLDFFLLKLSKDGNLMSSFCFGTNNDDQCISLINLSDHNLLLLGQTVDSTSNINGLAIKVDSLGNEIARLNYGVSNKNESFDAAVQLSDGSIVFAGFITDGFSTNNMLIAKFDNNFNLIFEDNYGGMQNDISQDVAVDLLNNIYIFGDTQSSGSAGVDTRVIKVSPEGVVLWDKTFGDQYNNGSQGILITDDNNLLIYGETYTSEIPPFDFWCQKINLDGDSIWKKTFGGNGSDAIFSCTKLFGNYFCTGYSGGENTSQPINAVYLQLTNDGLLLDEQFFGRSGIDIGYKVLVDSNYVYFAGKSQNDTDDDVMFNKIKLPLGLSIKRSAVLLGESPILNNFSSDFLIVNRNLINVKFELFSMDGKKIISSNKEYLFAGTKIDISFLQNGLYICTVISEKKQFQTKIFKL